jgi:hypothetical protein
MCAVLAVAAGILLSPSSQAQGGAPKYEADLAWPKPLPDRWVLGGLGGLCVDRQDHVFILNRQDVVEGDLNGGKLAPMIIEFDPAGNVVNSWADTTRLDPRLHSCHVDKDNNIWIASAPSGMVQKYSHDGSKLLLQIGKKGVLDSSDGTAKGKPLNSNAAQFFMPSSIFVDRQNGDVYVSDGEGAGSNRRVAVMDRTGKFLRQWLPEDMETVHCLTIANDGQVYVCNRTNSRIQIYDKMGKFKKNIEVPWTPTTPARREADTERRLGRRDRLLARCESERLMFVINQNNAQVEVIEAREPQAPCRVLAARKFPRPIQPGSRHRRGLQRAMSISPRTAAGGSTSFRRPPPRRSELGRPQGERIISSQRSALGWKSAES